MIVVPSKPSAKFTHRKRDEEGISGLKNVLE
jgi:hypothetical protein